MTVAAAATSFDECDQIDASLQVKVHADQEESLGPKHNTLFLHCFFKYKYLKKKS